MQEMQNLIGSMGFPIVMCLLLFYYISTTNKQLENLINAVHLELEHNTAILNNLQFIIKDFVGGKDVSQKSTGNDRGNDSSQ